jgi:hypothetical protein
MTAVDVRYVKLVHLVPSRRLYNSKFHFEFDCEIDIGHRWQHEIVFEDVLSPNPKQKMPLCIAGERACPPEDVGGTSGYETFLESIQNPNHPEHEAYKGWIGGAFAPERFDIDAINIAFRNTQ